MGQVLYFVEGVEAVSPELLKQLGLAYAFAGGCAQRRAGNGPGEQPGVVCAAQSEHVGYFPQAQVWHRLPAIAGAPATWLGWSLAAPPDPQSLARQDALDGHLVTLADGQEWQVPIAQRWTDSGFSRNVAARMRLDEQGQWSEGDVLPRFAGLWRVAQQWQEFRERQLAGEATSLSIAAAADMCAEVLAVNYRVSRREIGCLQLLDDRESYRTVLDAAIDLPTFVEFVRLQKKTEASAAE